MTRPSLLLIFSVLLFQTVSGCGGSNNGLTSTDDKLSGQWVAEKLDAKGDRLALSFTPGDGERRATLVAVRPSGLTVTVSEGTYSLDGHKLHFDFNDVTDLTAPFTVSSTQLTLGTDVYRRTALDGPVFGGQIQITQAVADEAVKVNSQSTPVSEILVKYKDGREEKLVVEPEGPEVEALKLQGAPKELTDFAFDKLARGDFSRGKAAVRLKELNQNPEVLYAVPNRLLKTQSLSDPTDTLFGDQWNLDAIKITDAWGRVSSDRPAVVAVIDTGIVRGHPDLPPDRVLFDFGYDFVHDKIDGIPDLSLDGDGPDSDPTDPGDRHDLGLPGGSSWHGTHIAGIIAAAIDNGLGIAGIAKNVEILPLRAMGSGGNGTLADVAQAIYYAAKLPNIAECNPFTVLANGGYSYNPSTWTCHFDEARPRADLINLSLGEAMTAFDATPLADAINAASTAGVVIVASAGNYHMGPGYCRNGDGHGFHADPACNFYPAANPNVLSIGALYPNNSFASSYSNFGGTQFLVAYGGSGSSGILSTVHPSVQGGYGELVGTSQAAAHVSAVAAMVVSEILSREPLISPPELPRRVKAALQTTAIELGPPGKDDQFGFGLLNPCGALLNAQGVPPSGTSTLELSSESVDFGTLGATHTIIITNGCGAVPIGGISATKRTDDGKDWLGATLSGDQSPSRLVLSVNRSGLSQGDYRGHVTVNTSSGNREVQVLMKVGATRVSPEDDIDTLRKEIEKVVSGEGGFENTTDIGEVQLLLLDAETGDPKVHTTTDFAANYHFQFLGVEPGRYHLVWGVDENQDGVICAQDGEPCRIYPNAASPDVIEVTATTKKNDLVLTF